MFNAKDRLPDRLRGLFELLFSKGMTEEQACMHLAIGIDDLSRDKQTMMRSLKAAAH